MTFVGDNPPKGQLGKSSGDTWGAELSSMQAIINRMMLDQIQI